MWSFQQDGPQCYLVSNPPFSSPTLWPVWSIEFGRSDGMLLPRLGCKRLCSFSVCLSVCLYLSWTTNPTRGPRSEELNLLPAAEWSWKQSLQPQSVLRWLQPQANSLSAISWETLSQIYPAKPLPASWSWDTVLGFGVRWAWSVS